MEVILHGMKRLLIIFLCFLFNDSKGNEPESKSFYFEINFALQHVLSYKSTDTWFEDNLDKENFLIVGLCGTKSFKYFDGNIGISIHQENIGPYSYQVGKGYEYYSLKSTHLSIPLGIDIKLSNNQDRYFILRVNNVLDFRFNSSWENYYGQTLLEEKEIHFFKYFLEFGLGYNALLSNSIRIRSLISLYSYPLYQEKIFDEDIRTKSLGILIGLSKAI